MNKVAYRISIPPRLVDEMMLKSAGAFEVPASQEGMDFMQQWEKLGSKARDEIMKIAYARRITLLEAHRRQTDATE